LSVFTQIFSNFITNNTQTFHSPDISLEQYPTPVSVLENIFSKNKDFTNKNVLDMGVGLGSLSFSCAWFGAKIIIGIDSDIRVMQSLRYNEKLFLDLYSKNKIRTTLKNETNSKVGMKEYLPFFSWIHSQIEFFPFKEFQNYFDFVVMNPPFGTQRSGIDFVFLQRATTLNCPIISMHKETPSFDRKVESLLKKSNYILESVEFFSFPLPKTMNHHKKEIQEIEIKLITAKPKNMNIYL
jgi:predicted RNA methylase